MSSASYALALDYAERLQQQVREWNATNWPEKSDDLLTHAAKMAEEVGEVLGAIIKSREAGRQRPKDEIVEEFGDLLMTMLTFAAVLRENELTKRWSFLDIALDKWDKVQTHRTAAGKAHDAAALAARRQVEP